MPVSVSTAPARARAAATRTSSMCSPGSNSLAPRKGEEGDQVGKGYVFGGLICLVPWKLRWVSGVGRGERELRARTVDVQVLLWLVWPG